MADATAIDRLYSEAAAVLDVLRRTSEVSLEIAATDHFRKALLLASASYFEYRVSASVVEFVRLRSNGSLLVENFVRNKAVARQYHTWFQWDSANANQFYGLFGDGFRTTMIERIKGSDQLRASVGAFLELGRERNRLVHDNYATFTLEKTLDEIYQLYRSAMAFIEVLPDALRDCDG